MPRGVAPVQYVPTVPEANWGRGPLKRHDYSVFVAAEGLFKDPFAVHEDRWFSAGSPTDLVKDGSSEMSDPPPDGPISGSPCLETRFDPPKGAESSIAAQSERRYHR